MDGRRETITQAGEVRSARLESIRALAALAVLVAHVFGQSRHYVAAETMNTFLHRLVFGGGYGVFVFFGLTGYLLFWPFARAGFGGGAGIDLRRYAINRVLRIVPLYVVAVVILLVAEENGGSLSQWWRFLTFSENFSTHTVGTVDGPMWSLVVEVHFYLLLPLLAWGLVKLSRGSKAASAAGLIVLALGSYLLDRHALTGVRRPLLEYSFPATFVYFVPGMLIALLRLRWEERPPGWLRGPLGAGDWWLLAAIPIALLQFRDYGAIGLMCLATFLIVGACVLPIRRGRIVALLDWRPLAVLGVASYSLYIWHVPIVTWLAGAPGVPHSFLGQLVIAGPASVLAALVSYRLIEAPFLALRRQWASGRRSAAPVRSGSAEAGPIPEVAPAPDTVATT